MPITEGDTFTNKIGDQFKVVRYINSKDVLIEFMDSHKYTMKTCSSHIYSGSVKNPYTPNVAGVGFLGVGEYSSVIKGKLTKEYKHWANMLHRCYNEYYLVKNPSYRGCSVAKKWHNFQVFAEWCQTQAGFLCVGWHLDKDILVRGNREYGPERCVFVPIEINCFVSIHSCDHTDRSLPKGVVGKKGRFYAQLKTKTYSQFLGSFDTSTEAHTAYTEAKEEYSKYLALTHKDNIDCRLFNKLINLKFEDI